MNIPKGAQYCHKPDCQCRSCRAEQERDEARATVARVKALADESQSSTRAVFAGTVRTADLLAALAGGVAADAPTSSDRRPDQKRGACLALPPATLSAASRLTHEAAMEAVSSGVEVVAYTGQGEEYARGRVLSFSIVPTVTIETADGRRVEWRHDLCEVSR